MAEANNLNQANLALGDTFGDKVIAAVYNAAAGRYLWADQASSGTPIGFETVADDTARGAWVTAAAAAPGTYPTGTEVRQLDTGTTYTWDDTAQALAETGTTLEVIRTNLDPADPATYAPNVAFVIVSGHATPSSDGAYAVVGGSLVPIT